MDFLTGSDHRPIFYTVDTSLLRTHVFKCKAWKETPWDAFAATVRERCMEAGLSGMGEAGHGDNSYSRSIEDRVACLTQILEEAITLHVPERTICWASKPWWSQEVAAARLHMRHMLHRAQRIGTELD